MIIRTLELEPCEEFPTVFCNNKKDLSRDSVQVSLDKQSRISLLNQILKNFVLITDSGSNEVFVTRGHRGT